MILCAAALLSAACSSVTKRLIAGDPQVRAMAMDQVLHSDEKVRKEAALRMKAILARKNSPYRMYAVSALEDLGPAAAPAIPELISALPGGDQVSFSAARILSKLDAAAPALAETLKSKDPALRREAARLLPAHGGIAAPLLAKNLAGADQDLAVESARILSEIGPAAKDAVPPLARAAFSGGKDLKTWASIALVKIGPPAGKWLAAALKAPNPRIRSGGARVLSAMYPPPPEAAEALLASLADADAGVRTSAAMALANYPHGTQAHFSGNYIDALFRAAQAADEDTRLWAAIGLVKLGPPAGKWLAKALKDPLASTRAGAALVLSRMFPPPPEAAAAVLYALKDSDRSVRRAAASALGTYATANPHVLPGNAWRKIAVAMKFKDPQLRSALIFPLGRLALKSRQAAAVLAGAINDRDAEVRKSAATALAALGPAARDYIPELRKGLKSRDCPLRVLSARALIAIDPAFRRNTAAVRAAGTECPGTAISPRIEPITAIAEKVQSSATGQALPPLIQELKGNTGQTPASR